MPHLTPPRFDVVPVFFVTQDSRAARARGLPVRHFRMVLPASPAVAARKDWTMTGLNAHARLVSADLTRTL